MLDADKERALLELILNSMSEGVIAVDAEGHFLLFNATARRLFTEPEAGASLDDWRRQNPLLTLERKPVVRADGPLTQTLRGASIDNWRLIFAKPGAQDRVLSMSTRPLRSADDAQIGGVLVFNDITRRKAAEDFALAQERVLAMIAGGAELPRSLDAIVRLMEASLPGSLCSILLLQGQELRHGAAPSLPDSYTQAIDGLQVREGVGACGTAAFRKEPVVVEDVEHDPLMQGYRDLLLAHDLRACWSTPVISSDGDVLATFAIYRRTRSKPAARELELIATATRLAGIALERARAEAALVGSEARFQELAENVEDVFYNRDFASGRFLYVSPAYESVWCSRREKLYAEADSYLERIHPEDKAAEAETKARQAGGRMTDLEYRLVLPGGAIRWIRDRSYPVMNAAGKVERIVGTARDITERKLADLTLASSNRALQMLSRSSMAINRTDDEASLLAEVCRVAVEVGGYRMAWVGYAQDDEARSIQPMAHAGIESGYLDSMEVSWRDDHPTGQGPAGQAIRGGQPVQSGDISQSTSFYWRDAAMQRGYRSAICLPLREEARTFGVLCLYAGELVQFASDEIKLLQELADNLASGIGNLRARVARKQAEEEIKYKNMILQTQQETSLDAILVVDEDGKIISFNQQFIDLWRLSPQLVSARLDAPVLQSVAEQVENSEAFFARVQYLYEHRDGKSREEIPLKDGRVIDRYSAPITGADGQHYGRVWYFRDITERNQAREEVLRLNASLEERVQQRTAQLEFANKQMESFAYSVSHDLRSPLNAIDGFSSLLEKTVAKMESGALTERSAHYLARIRAGVAQMGELIEGLLGLSLVARADMLWEPVDLSALGEALLNRYHEREPGRATLLRVEAGLLARGDPRLLRQVLDNLLGNAWKFSAGQARTEITLGRETGSAGETVYFVRDNGAGFDMAYADKLFGAFQRLHTLDEFAGTGIGLATVQRIIERHGGRIWGESAPGQGATFYFTLGSTTL